MIKPIENSNLLEDNKRKIDKVLEEIEKGEKYGWRCPLPFPKCDYTCPYFKISHPSDRCLNREKFIQIKEGMELTPNQLEEIEKEKNLYKNTPQERRLDNSQVGEPERLVSEMERGNALQKSPVRNDKPIYVGNPDKEDKKCNSTQILLLVIASAIIILIAVIYGLAKNGDFHSVLVDNSTCSNNLTIPEFPACPACSLTCPASLINFTIPNNLNITCSNHS